jgi:hypothetical protein
VASLITKVLDHWDRLHHHFVKEVFVNHLPIAQKQHWQILRAIRTDDADEVESLVRKHNQSALRAYEEYLRRQKSGRGNGSSVRRIPREQLATNDSETTVNTDERQRPHARNR